MRHLWGKHTTGSINFAGVKEGAFIWSYVDGNLRHPGKDPGNQFTVVFDSKSIVPVANKNQPRVYGVLACVYLGIPK